MNEPGSENDVSLIPHRSQELALPSDAETRILSEMIECSLALAKESAVARVDLDALVREAKRLYLSRVSGITAEDLRAFEPPFGTAILRKIEILKREKGQRGMTDENVRAFHLLIRAAEAGHSEAQFLVADCCYGLGNGISSDRSESIKWFRRAAEQGNTDAQRAIGYSYEVGCGVQKDLTEAARWYRTAADQGDFDAQIFLGSCYEKGDGVPQNSEEAVRWYRKAAQQGCGQGQFRLGWCYLEGRGVPRDHAKAGKWIRKAADQGYIGAQFHLAVCSESGLGTRLDYAEARKWYRKAAEQGHVVAQYRLGCRHRDGSTGFPKDYREAVKWFHKAAEQLHADSQYNLGLCHQYGRGVPIDMLEAYRWYQLAEDSGHEEAKERVTSLAVLMSSSELDAARALYHEFKVKHSE